MSYSTELLKEFDEWNRTVMKKIFTLENKWVESNALRVLGTTKPEICKTRCLVEKGELSKHVWVSYLYIDKRLISVLGINSVTLKYRTETTDGFVQEGTL